MQENHVVTCFLVSQARVLLLKRSARVGSYQERWAGISGFLEPGISPLEQAQQEIEEETGLKQDEYELIREGEALAVVDDKIQCTWLVHPFRFKVIKPEKIRIDWEHSEFRWVDPGDIPAFQTVPGLHEAWQSVE